MKSNNPEEYRGVAGIYEFFDKSSEDSLYVGKSIDLLKRFRSHVRALKSGEHIQKEFQQWFDTNEENLGWRVLEVLQGDTSSYGFTEDLSSLEYKYFLERAPKFFGTVPHFDTIPWGVPQIDKYPDDYIVSLYEDKGLFAGEIATFIGYRDGSDDIVIRRLQSIGCKPRRNGSWGNAEYETYGLHLWDAEIGNLYALGYSLDEISDKILERGREYIAKRILDKGFKRNKSLLEGTWGPVYADILHGNISYETAANNLNMTLEEFEDGLQRYCRVSGCFLPIRGKAHPDRVLALESVDADEVYTLAWSGQGIFELAKQYTSNENSERVRLVLADYCLRYNLVYPYEEPWLTYKIVEDYANGKLSAPDLTILRGSYSKGVDKVAVVLATLSPKAIRVLKGDSVYTVAQQVDIDLGSRVAELRSEGYSYNAISDEMQIRARDVRLLLEKYLYNKCEPLDYGLGLPVGEQEERVYEMYSSGMTKEQVAARMGLSVATVNRRYRSYVEHLVR